MKYILTLLLIFSVLPAFSLPITGKVDKQIESDFNRVIDSETDAPIPGASVRIPAKNFRTVTDKNGAFELKTEINSPVIMSVYKQGYKPFSVTINEYDKGKPVCAAISKSSSKDVVIDTDMIHIGDNSFSQNSANAGDFCLRSCGAFYSKDFKINKFSPSELLFLTVGSIIGIDTSQAQKLGQSRVLTAFSSPPEIYFNNNKIADIKINGDNQKILIPYGLINFEGLNNITVRAGKNLCKTSAVDYDDIEFMNLLLEFK